MLSADAATAGLPPHPELRDYYRGAGVKRGLLRRMFDRTAVDYDYVERLLSLGTGSWYRRQALGRAGLTAGMRVLDVAVGTGLVAREEIGITGNRRLITGLDPSPGMLRRAVDALNISAMPGVGEHLPLADGSFGFLSMGYALRHLTDLRRAFSEFARASKPGGRLCILEITAPRNRLGRMLLRGYMPSLVPMLTRVTTGRADSQLLWRYYWDTIEACVRLTKVKAALKEAGFINVGRYDQLGIFTEYTGARSA